MGAAKNTIELAIQKAGGLRALSRALDWNSGSLMRVLGGEKISPYRAAQVADYLETGRKERDEAVFLALGAMAKTEAEQSYWAGRVRECRVGERARQLALAAWVASGDDSIELYEKLEQATLSELLAENEPSKASPKRKIA